MGQKIHPLGFRLGVQRIWTAKWYGSNRNFSSTLLEDIKVRDYLKKKLAHASVSKVLIERPAKIFRQRRSMRKRLPRRVVNDLRVNVVGASENGQTRASGRTRRAPFPAEAPRRSW